MNAFIGTKLINATPMTRLAYNEFRGWTLPADENGDDAGYLVEYTDGGKANTTQYAGYVSWSPKDVFDKAYRPCDSMPFGLAIEALKRGEKVARGGWNGKGMWLSLASEWNAKLGNGISLPSDWAGYNDFIAMYTADKKLVPWLASQADVLAEDWSIVK